MGDKVQRKIRQNVRKMMAAADEARRGRIGKTMDGIATLPFFSRVKLAWMIIFKRAR